MLKKVLLGCVLSAFAVAVSAQELVKPIHRGLVKNSNKTELKAKLMPQQGLKMSEKGWLGNADVINKAFSPISRKSMAKADAATNTFWFGYPTDSQGRIWTIANDLWSELFNNWNFETQGSTSYCFFMQIPASYAGASIDSVANMFCDVAEIKNLKLWLHNITLSSDGDFSMPTSAQNADYNQDIYQNQLVAGTSDGVSYSEFKLNKKFVIGDDGCLVGFEFEAPSDAKNILAWYIETGGTEGSFYVKFKRQGQEGFLSMSSYLGNLTTCVHIDATGLSTAKASAEHAYETSYAVGKEGELGVRVKNEGISTINSLSYVMTVDQQAQAEKTVTLSEETNASNQVISGNSQGVVYLPLPSAVTAGEHFVTVEITKVNGKDNESTTTSTGAYVLGIANPAVRTSVVEEATSTACGYCPRGTVGMEKVKEALGDKVITLSVHGQQSKYDIDPMETEDYILWQYSFVNSFPTAFINRASFADPYEGFGQNSSTTLYRFGLDKAVQYVDGIMPSEGTVSLVATPADMSKVNVTSNVTFNLDREVAPYGLVYVLTQDGLTGNDVIDANQYYTALWSQENYYSQEFIDMYKQAYGQDVSTKYQDTDMDIYKNGSFMYTEPNGYNNVVVGAWGSTYTESGQNYVNVVQGLPFITTDEVEAGKTYTDSRVLDLSTKGLIQSHKNLKLAALLINSNNGEIVNAAQVALDFTSGINNVQNSSSKSEVARYNVNGVRMTAPVKGLNIVKMADGSVKKFMVK